VKGNQNFGMGRIFRNDECKRLLSCGDEIGLICPKVYCLQKRESAKRENQNFGIFRMGRMNDKEPFVAG
jgi:hypothetical protein